MIHQNLFPLSPVQGLSPFDCNHSDVPRSHHPERHLQCRGNEIDRQCWEGSQRRLSTRLWPRQETPPSRAWSVWRKYLSCCYMDILTTRKKQDNLWLTYPLGQWTHSSTLLWRYFINPISLTIYHHRDNKIWTFSPCNNSRTQLTYQRTGRTTNRPPSTLPIDCHQVADHITVCKRDIPRSLSPANAKFNTFSKYIAFLKPWETALFHNLNFKCTIHEFLNILTTPNIIASDGSVKDSKGSFGWVIATSMGHILATGSGVAFGHDITSFRSEGYGILAPLRLLYHLQTFYHQPLHNCPLTWYCDSESLIKRLNSNLQDTHNPNPNRYKPADNDIEMAITSTIPLVSTILHRHHLRSHQHDQTPLHKLPLPQRLNRMADTLASLVHQETNTSSNWVPLITIAGCQLHTKHGTITRLYTCTLHNKYTHQQTTRHICKD